MSQQSTGTDHTDRAGREYWEGRWKTEALPAAVVPDNPSIWNYVNRRLASDLIDSLGNPEGRRLLEIGCGNSVWLPWFARAGFEIHGIDYSPQGCEGSRRLLEREGVDGTVHLADLFEPPVDLRGSFDAVVSFGVVEHFDDTDSAVAAAAEFLAPGGTIYTLIPNMNGIPGFVQKLVNRPVYDAHVPLTPSRLGEAHARAGLEVIASRYFLGVNFGVNNLQGRDPSKAGTVAARYLLGGLTLAGAGTWWGEEKLGIALPRTRLLSPYVVTTAKRGGGTAT